MEQKAVELGISSTAYWSMTFDEIMTQVSANKNNYERQLKEKAMFDYNLIQGISYAFNDPKHLPKAEEMYSILKGKEGQTSKVNKEQTEYNADTDKALFMEIAKNVKRTVEKKKGG